MLESVFPNVCLFMEQTYKKVIKVTRGYKGEAFLSLEELVP